MGRAESASSTPFNVPTDLCATLRQRRRVGLPRRLPGPASWQATWNAVRRVQQIEWEERFASRERIEAALHEYVPAYDPRAQQRLNALALDLSLVMPRFVYQALLRRMGRDANAIISWVRRNLLHINYHDLAIDAEGGRALSPLETLFVGLGGCGTFANLTAVLLHHAGHAARVWDVVGHSFVEFRTTTGRPQLEDVDLPPSSMRLPRGLHMQSLLESYPDWVPLLESVPRVTWVPLSQAFVPTEDEGKIYQRIQLDPVAGFSSFDRIDSVGRVQQAWYPIEQAVTPLADGRGFQLSFADMRPGQCLVLALCLSHEPKFRPQRIGPPALEGRRQHDHFLDEAIGDAVQRIEGESDEVIWARITHERPYVEFRPALKGSCWLAVLLHPEGLPNAFPYWNREATTQLAPITGDLPANPDPLARPVNQPRIEAWDTAYAELKQDPPLPAAPGARYARGYTGGLAATHCALQAQGIARGARALDAGCGTGEWTLPLSLLFDAVDALDRNSERVAFLHELLSRLQPRPNVRLKRGALEDLPYADESFDFIFCNGVMFSADAEQALREFFRVLRRGGSALVSLNADGWNLHLRRDQGPRNPDALRQGRDTLYNSAWHRYGDAFRASIRRTRPVWSRALRRLHLAGRRLSPHAPLEALLGAYERALADLSLDARIAVRRLELHARDLCGDEHTGVILFDLLSIGAGRKSEHTTSVGSRAWEPGEFRKLTESLGFDSFRWAPYGRPRSIDGEPALKRGPISSIATSGNVNLLHYRGEWATWECEFRKPR